MSITTPIKELYQPDKVADLFWRRFEELEGFASLSKGYLAHRLDILWSQSFTLPKRKVLPIPQRQGRRLLFIDGFFHREGSFFPEAIILSLEEASLTYASYLEGRLQKMMTKEKSALATLNGAFAKEGAFLYLPPNTHIEKPIEIIHIHSKPEDQNTHLLSPRLQMVIGRHSQLKLVIEEQTEALLCSNRALDLQLEEGAHVELISLFAGSDEGYLFDSLRATLKANSRLSGHIISSGAKAAIRDYHIEMVGEGASAEIKVALRLTERRQEQLGIVMEHRAPHCTSQQMIKQVGYEATRHSFSGTIYVHKTAKETASYQKHCALLLSPTAFSAVQPNLEIYTDEVKASHGATAGQLNKEAIFYLTSRGLSKESAERLLIEAHLREITDSISIEEIKQRAQRMVS